ncbi:DUF3644 domain-containing protein [Arsenophonus nasoniae]|uniref:DUF3644 domain-containing protein n=3 Tax=Arsenophonus nasoniae TaxID=638 RepID=A0AA95G8G7_9GAMM|nr:DUF3644 domain-containing protein [Arsenophonus nasoniae]WGL94146.1 DUF3644 domain-containing protein [Arsenophonus nasoniae]
MSKYDKVDLAYDFLIQREKNNESFTINELSAATGWKKQTCGTYPSKRWHQYIQKDGKHYSIAGICYLTKDEFRMIHSQKLQYSNITIPSAKSILLHKAKEFALLAVSTYNNPYATFKTYGYIVNIIIAYTALFHAIFEKHGQNYYHTDQNGKAIKIDGEKKAWELSECSNVYWQGIESPEKYNLKFLIGLRNKIEHRSLPAVDLAVAGECQSALSNFETLLIKEFGDEQALYTNLAIAMQLTRTSEQAQNESLKQLQTKNYKVVRQYMETYRANLDDSILESQKYRLRVFLVPKLGNHAKSSDLAVEFVNVNKLDNDELQNYEHSVAFIKEQENPYKLKPTKIVKLVSEKLKFFNMSLHTQCWKYFNARPKNSNVNFKGEYACYSEGFDGYLYSKKWVDFLISELKKPDVLAAVKKHT